MILINKEKFIKCLNIYNINQIPESFRPQAS